MAQKDLKSRIASVKNIQKITRAMEMVAAARLRRAEQRIERLRPYAGAIRRMTRQAAEAAGDIPQLPILNEHENEKRVAGRLKLELSQYRELEAFAQFGSELDVETQRTLARGERLVATLNQKERQPLPVADQVVQVYAATHGYLDRINVDKVDEFLEGLTQRFHAEQQDVRKRLTDGDWDDELERQVDEAVKGFAEDFGYDLDEEGMPLEEPETADEERVRRDLAAEEAGGDGAAPAEEPQQEPAAVS